mgnify:CR=1 FL=1
MWNQLARDLASESRNELELRLSGTSFQSTSLEPIEEVTNRIVFPEENITEVPERPLEDYLSKDEELVSLEDVLPDDVQSVSTAQSIGENLDKELGNTGKTLREWVRNSAYDHGSMPNDEDIICSLNPDSCPKWTSSQIIKKSYATD